MNEERITYPIKDRWSFLWLAIGTLLGFLWMIPLIHWVSPIFMIRFMRSQKVWIGFLLVFLTSFVVFAVSLREMLPMDMPEYLITMFIAALTAAALPYLADRLLVPKISGFAATLVFPLAIVIMDYIGALTNPLGSLGSVAYFQYGNLYLMQLVSITGIWGITFLVNWLGPVFNYVWERTFTWAEIRRGVAIFVSIMVAVLVFGGARLALAQEPSGTVRMHGITAVDMVQELPNVHEAEKNDWQTYRQLAADLREPYFEQTLQEAQGGAQLVHWPEMAVWVPADDEAEFLNRAREIARQEGIYLSMPIGKVYQDDTPWENKLLIIDPAGEIVLEHDKYGNAVAEGSKPGDGVLRTIETPFGTVSGIICNDTNHQEVVAQAGRNGTNILLSPSLEYRGIDPIHAHMASYRAIENGLTLVRQADNGLSIVTDPYGRVVASVGHFTASERVMVAQVPIYNVKTLYSYTPDYFAWLAILVFVILTIVAIVQGRKSKRAEKAEQG
jgi:apolipoprotein N-acyltransferase